MSKVYLGLGSNLGDPTANIEEALKRLQQILPKSTLRISPVYETPALLPESAEVSWNRPYLNLAVESDCDDQPEELIRKIKEIEKTMGRIESQRWSPRVIDIDILFWEGRTFDSKNLKIPHPLLFERAFVLDPLKDLNANFLRQARSHPQHSPVWMAILNITPDSFSDGGKYQNLDSIAAYCDSIDKQVGILDLGAESTRPGAMPLDWEEEWHRLRPVLNLLNDRYRDRLVKPILSVDTRHAEVAVRAIEMGAKIINDVSGGSDPKLLDVLKTSQCRYVLMHSLSIPADPKTIIKKTTQVLAELKNWFHKKLNELELLGIDPSRVIIDPGIGFGKDSLQSLTILRGLDQLEEFPCQLMVGHSRKSFLKEFSSANAEDRDLESVGVTLSLIKKGVDILRVHNPVAHIRAYRAYSHVNERLIYYD